MWRLLLGASILVATVNLLGGLGGNKVHACSSGDYDPFAESDIIVAGRYVGYDTVPNPPSTPQTYVDQKTGKTESWQRAPSLTETMVLSVDRVYKGTGIGTHVTIVNLAFLERPPSGSCGGTPYDPTGRYTLTGLRRAGDGAYYYFHSFFGGDDPSGEGYQLAVERITAEVGLGSLPTAGSGPAAPSGVEPATLAGAAAAIAAALISFSAVRSVRRDD